MPFGISIWELMILLIVLLLIFGAKRLPEMGRSLGKGMREFKDSVSGVEEAVSTTTTARRPTPPRRASVRHVRARSIRAAGARTRAGNRHLGASTDDPPLAAAPSRPR